MGTITEHSGKYITVEFTGATKKFVYPDAFESFLALADGSVSDSINSDLDASKKAKQDILDKKKEENMRAMTHGIVIPGKEAVAADGEEEDSRFKDTDEV